jgi:hypothetical protein
MMKARPELSHQDFAGATNAGAWYQDRQKHRPICP